MRTYKDKNGKLQFHCGDLSRILTAGFNQDKEIQLKQLFVALKGKIIKKKKPFASLEDLYAAPTTGLVTDKKNFLDLLELKAADNLEYLTDSSRGGVYNYLQMLWKINHLPPDKVDNLHEYVTSIGKGYRLEEKAFKVLSAAKGELILPYNGKAFEVEGLVGNPDSLKFYSEHRKMVHEMKVPTTFSDWLSKYDVPYAYKAQVSGYIILTGAIGAQLHYVLMPDDPKTLRSKLRKASKEEKEYIIYENAVINSMTPAERVKTFSVTPTTMIPESYIFDKIKKATKYYESLELGYDSTGNYCLHSKLDIKGDLQDAQKRIFNELVEEYED